MQDQEIDNEQVTLSWNVVRWFFKREQENAHSITILQNQVSSLQNSLHTSGWRTQNVIVEKNALSAHYDQLHRDYLKLFEAYEQLEKRIDHKSEAFCSAQPNGLGIMEPTPQESLAEDIMN